MSHWSATRSSRAAGILLAAILACACGTTSAAIPTPSAAQTPSCVTPQAAEFNFWIGSWKGSWSDDIGPATGTDVVVRSACEIDETFQAARFLGHTDYADTSRSHWDPALSKWVQDYSDNAGERSRWTGGFANGAMTLIGPPVGSRQQRIIWRDIRADGWNWEYDSSTDGATWSAQVVIAYTRVK